MDLAYYQAEVKRREQLEVFAIKRFKAIHTSRTQRMLENLDAFGAEGLLRYTENATYPLGWENEWKNLFVKYYREWVGLGYTRSGKEIQAQYKQIKNAADPFQHQMNNAMSYWDKHAIKLASVEDKDLLTLSKILLKSGINEGLGHKDIAKNLGKVFKDFDKSRLVNIARTESGKAYNWGILTNLYENMDICRYVEVVAVMDKRTTDICIDRDGIIIPLKNMALVAKYTPPFHFQCRSRLVGVVKPSKVKNLPKDSELEKVADGINESNPIFHGFGLKPEDLDIFKAATRKIWKLNPYKKTKVKKPDPPPETPPKKTPTPKPEPVKKVAKTTTKPKTPKKVTYENAFVKKINPTAAPKAYIPDGEKYKIVVSKNFSKTNINMIKSKMDDYHQLFGRDQMLDRGVYVARVKENYLGCVKSYRTRDKFGNINNYLNIGDGDMELWFNPKYFKKSDKLFRKDVGDWGVTCQFHPVGCESLAATVDHEMGHVMHGLINRTKHRDAFNAEIKALWDAPTKMMNNRPRLKALRKTTRGSYLADQEIATSLPLHFKTELSQYAQTNQKEMMAEGWSEYCNNPNPRPWAKKIGELFIKYINKL